MMRKWLGYKRCVGGSYKQWRGEGKDNFWESLGSGMEGKGLSTKWGGGEVFSLGVELEIFVKYALTVG